MTRQNWTGARPSGLDPGTGCFPTRLSVRAHPPRDVEGKPTQTSLLSISRGLPEEGVSIK